MLSTQTLSILALEIKSGLWRFFLQILCMISICHYSTYSQQHCRKPRTAIALINILLNFKALVKALTELHVLTFISFSFLLLESKVTGVSRQRVENK